MDTLNPEFRRKAELFGLVCGIAGGVLAVTVPSASMVLWIVSASMLAGAIGNLLTNAGDDPGLRPRAGIRAGVIAAIVGGAVAVLCFTSQNRFVGFRVMLPALLAIPPGAFFGLLGSLMVSMIQNPQVCPVGQWEPKTRTKPSVLLIATLACSAIGYASPFIASYLPERKEPVVTSIASAPAVKPASEPSQPAPPSPPSPPWKYEMPPNFAEARPGQVKVMKEVSLGRFDAPLRYAFAKDGRTFAFAQSDSSIVALDLNEPETITTFAVPERPQRFAFSPDAKRLFCITESGAKHVLTPGSTIRLPLPKDTPGGDIEWVDEKHVRIGSQLLDLDTLKLASATGSVAPPPRHPNIELRTTSRLLAMQGRNTETETRHFLADTKRDFATMLPVIGEQPFLTPDATKLLYSRDHELIVAFFDLRPSREMKLAAQMPHGPPAEFADDLKARRLIVLLCPTIINPLNNKPVGADVTRVKAVLGIESWEGMNAKFWVKEDYGAAVENGDAVAVPMSVRDGRMRTLDSSSDSWALARDVSPGDAPDIIAPPTREPLKPDVLPRETPPIVPPNPPAASDSLAGLLRKFVHLHHEKSSRGDVDGLVADYAERVDHLKGSVVDREVIRKEELEYHSPGSRVSETIVGEISISAVSETRYRANYTIRFELTRPSGSWARGFSDIELVIDVASASPLTIPQIVRQRAKNRDTQKGP